jgi:hypothetical protein
MLTAVKAVMDYDQPWHGHGGTRHARAPGGREIGAIGCPFVKNGSTNIAHARISWDPSTKRTNQGIERELETRSGDSHQNDTHNVTQATARAKCRR